MLQQQLIAMSRREGLEVPNIWSGTGQCDVHILIEKYLSIINIWAAAYVPDPLKTV